MAGFLRRSLDRLQTWLPRILTGKSRSRVLPRVPALPLGHLLGDDRLVPGWSRPLELAALLDRHRIAPRGVIHLGAHVGGELDAYRALGCSPIVLVDANPAMIPVLQRRIGGHPGVHLVHAAITDHEGPVMLHVTNAEQSSSILPLAEHASIYPRIREVRTEEVPGKTIDGMLRELGLPPAQFNLLVMDIQGAELKALRGAATTIPSLEAVLTEYSLCELYEGCSLLGDLERHLASEGLFRAAECAPWHPAWGDALYVRRPIVAMSSLGTNGRFGNQLFQYLFVSTVARRNGAILQVPDWVGSHLYGLDDPPPRLDLPRYDELEPDRTTSIELRSVPAVELLGPDPRAVGIDYRGYFQFHSSFLSPIRDDARRMFTPVPGLEARLRASMDRLRSRCRHVVAVHLRRGDYGYGCFFRAPCPWYLEWILGRSLDPSDAVVYLASETPEAYRRRFRPFETCTARDISSLPESLDWLVDFEIMRAADSLAISNSSFSFMAAFLGPDGRCTARPCTEAMSLIEFDPAAAPVLLTRPVSQAEHRRLAELDG